jgi:hypothetical protein
MGYKGTNKRAKNKIKACFYLFSERKYLRRSQGMKNPNGLFFGGKSMIYALTFGFGWYFG